MSTSESGTLRDQAGQPRPEIGSEHRGREQQVLDRIDRARRRKARIREERITMAHGAGGKATHTLIEAVFLDAFRNPMLERMEDQAVFPVAAGRMAFTTDSYVVSPLFFPGGDIGELAVNGTVNDLAMAGARPLHLSAGFILEEGFPVADLQRIAASIAGTAVAAGVTIVTGDTKVVQRGKADGCYVNTAGIGVLEREVMLGADRARPGDAVLVSGPIGEHGGDHHAGPRGTRHQLRHHLGHRTPRGPGRRPVDGHPRGPLPARCHQGRGRHHPQRGGGGLRRGGRGGRGGRADATPPRRKGFTSTTSPRTRRRWQRPRGSGCTSRVVTRRRAGPHRPIDDRSRPAAGGQESHFQGRSGQ